ncbi:E3 ubiquitin-protein ligase HOS1 protein [Dioscorea alata]|uniref:E3 ubiquitin-protein ligase HOS1 protein n=1 Tax=Dioscorea alata TaxID=55571 RepID=A0ACB7U1X0_DIOAL|nr:E3 ubiquitin-protein ligase HOS1 protein [Dioscorea alata]
MEPEMNSHKCLPSNASLYQNVLEHMASIDLIELCNEAKIEHCRATRDLSSCGRYVKHVLESCGHAALCAECSQRCDVCPICRTALPTSGSKVRLRLYYKCIEAGLISKKLDDRFQEKKDIGEHSAADIERLYSLFDVALENNLVSLICHYVTDVCMDENAVSSDPVLAFLLDEVVVKDWCKRKFKRIIHELSGIYALGIEAMKDKMNLLQKFVLQLTGVSSVLEVMDASFKETLSAQLHDLHQLLESTLKTKQHLEVMIWCIQHHFLEDVPSRYPDSASWNRFVRERKSAAVKRAWPNFTSTSVAFLGSNEATLFIEEALSNLGIEESYSQDIEEDLDISCLQQEHSPLLFLSKIDEGNTNRKEGWYPFGNLRVAADVLFLHGTSDMVLAKQAIFLYYLFDRQWTRPDSEWRYLVDDFAAFFGITRHSLLESLTFYLLDDDSDQTLQEASILLPQIAGPETHPKIAQVLLERQRPDIALSVLRCTGHDGTCGVANSKSISLNQAVTAVRVKIECGLLTEAFMYQRMHCSRVKEDNIKQAPPGVFSESLTPNSWNHHVEVLVSEICYLCSRRNLVDRIIELPWNSNEEKYLHSCLFEYARQDPSSVHGSLLVVFYLQRYRYIEAYQVDRELQKLEHNVTVSASEEVASRIRSISHWRAAMIDKSVNLLPEVERKKITATNVFDSAIFGSHAVQTPLAKDFAAESENPAAISNSSVKPSVLLTNLESRKASPNAHTNLSSPRGGHPFEFGNKGPSVIHRRLLNASERSSSYRINTLGGGMSSPHTSNGEYSPSNGNIVRHPIQQNNVKQGYQSAGLLIPTSNPINLQSTPQREAKAASGLLHNDWQLHGLQSSFGFEPNDIAIQAESSHSLLPRIIPEDSNSLINTPHNNGFRKDPFGDQNSLISEKRNLLDRSLSNLSSEEANMNTRRGSPTKDLNMKGMPRWRSDESSEDEEDHALRKHRAGNTPFVMPRRAKHPWR